jgi:antitoxin component YwqK of YwqJK toxin-antitoxin module
VGIFIRNIIEMMKDYKKNGKYREYYDNGNLKYEGNFKDDEYDDEDGKFIFENGNRYNGHFKNGKKHGTGSLFNNNNEFIKQCEYENDVEIIREANSNNNERDDEEENNGNNFLDFNDLLRQSLEIFKPVGDIV